MRTCKLCGIEKELDQFYTAKGKPIARCKPCFRANAWQDKEKKASREFFKKYGITYDEYDKMLAAQNGVCCICLKDDPKGRWKSSSRGFCVDHDHSTGIIRGLLCNTCNQGLGNYYDSSELLRRAADYKDLHDSRQHPSQTR